jgi:hypothetical protein
METFIVTISLVCIIIAVLVFVYAIMYNKNLLLSCVIANYFCALSNVPFIFYAGSIPCLFSFIFCSVLAIFFTFLYFDDKSSKISFGQDLKEFFNSKSNRG